MSNVRRQLTPETAAAMQACVDHARDLLAAAKSVHAIGRYNIAYHLGILVLEEIGKRVLIGIQAISKRHARDSEWVDRRLQDHVQKLFWCFFGGTIEKTSITGPLLESYKSLAERLHAKRLTALYVDQGKDGHSIPADTIAADECDSLLNLADARLAMASEEKLRDEVPEEEVQLQLWFLKAAEDPELKRLVFSSQSMTKLSELGVAMEWARWLRETVEASENEARAAAEAELARSREDLGTGKRKWKVRVRIMSGSHSVRGKALNAWNAKSDWLKLVPVPEKKNQLIVEMILPDTVPLTSLYLVAWGIARRFVVALNIGTMGFWWWRLPEQVSRYYESIEDLETRHRVGLDRSPSLKVDWGGGRALSEAELSAVLTCFVALPGHQDTTNHEPFNHYIGGLTFLSLNDVHWQCELEACRQFLDSMRAMMASTGALAEGSPIVPSFLSFLDGWLSEFDERAEYVALIEAVESRQVPTQPATLKHVSFLKLFCDAYFLQRVRPQVMERLRTEGRQESERAPS
jgi:AbiV family abortive infection protein